MKGKLWMSLAVLGAGVDGCSNTAPTGNASGGNSAQKQVVLWDIQTGDLQKVIQNMVNRFNQSHKDVQAKVEFFENDPYKQSCRSPWVRTIRRTSSLVGTAASSSRTSTQVTCTT